MFFLKNTHKFALFSDRMPFRVFGAERAEAALANVRTRLGSGGPADQLGAHTKAILKHAEALPSDVQAVVSTRLADTLRATHDALAEEMAAGARDREVQRITATGLGLLNELKDLVSDQATLKADFERPDNPLNLFLRLGDLKAEAPDTMGMPYSTMHGADWSRMDGYFNKQIGKLIDEANRKNNTSVLTTEGQKIQKDLLAKRGALVRDQAKYPADSAQARELEAKIKEIDQRIVDNENKTTIEKSLQRQYNDLLQVGKNDAANAVQKKMDANFVLCARMIKGIIFDVFGDRQPAEGNAWNTWAEWAAKTGKMRGIYDYNILKPLSGVDPRRFLITLKDGQPHILGKGTRAAFDDPQYQQFLGDYLGKTTQLADTLTTPGVVSVDFHLTRSAPFKMESWQKEYARTFKKLQREHPDVDPKTLAEQARTETLRGFDWGSHNMLLKPGRGSETFTPSAEIHAAFVRAKKGQPVTVEDILTERYVRVHNLMTPKDLPKSLADKYTVDPHDMTKPYYNYDYLAGGKPQIRIDWARIPVSAATVAVNGQEMPLAEALARPIQPTDEIKLTGTYVLDWENKELRQNMHLGVLAYSYIEEHDPANGMHHKKQALYRMVNTYSQSGEWQQNDERGRQILGSPPLVYEVTPQDFTFAKWLTEKGYQPDTPAYYRALQVYDHMFKLSLRIRGGLTLPVIPPDRLNGVYEQMKATMGGTHRVFSYRGGSDYFSLQAEILTAALTDHGLARESVKEFLKTYGRELRPLFRTIAEANGSSYFKAAFDEYQGRDMILGLSGDVFVGTQMLSEIGTSLKGIWEVHNAKYGEFRNEVDTNLRPHKDFPIPKERFADLLSSDPTVQAVVAGAHHKESGGGWMLGALKWGYDKIPTKSVSSRGVMQLRADTIRPYIGQLRARLLKIREKFPDEYRKYFDPENKKLLERVLDPTNIMNPTPEFLEHLRDDFDAANALLGALVVEDQLPDIENIMRTVGLNPRLDPVSRMVLAGNSFHGGQKETAMLADYNRGVLIADQLGFGENYAKRIRDIQEKWRSAMSVLSEDKGGMKAAMKTKVGRYNFEAMHAEILHANIEAVLAEVREAFDTPNDRQSRAYRTNLENIRKAIKDGQPTEKQSADIARLEGLLAARIDRFAKIKTALEAAGFDKARTQRVMADIVSQKDGNFLAKADAAGTYLYPDYVVLMATIQKALGVGDTIPFGRYLQNTPTTAPLLANYGIDAVGKAFGGGETATASLSLVSQAIAAPEGQAQVPGQRALAWSDQFLRTDVTGIPFDRATTPAALFQKIYGPLVPGVAGKGYFAMLDAVGGAPRLREKLPTTLSDAAQRTAIARWYSHALPDIRPGNAIDIRYRAEGRWRYALAVLRPKNNDPKSIEAVVTDSAGGTPRVMAIDTFIEMHLAAARQTADVAQSAKQNVSHIELRVVTPQQGERPNVFRDAFAAVRGNEVPDGLRGSLRLGAPLEVHTFRYLSGTDTAIGSNGLSAHEARYTGTARLPAGEIVTQDIFQITRPLTVATGRGETLTFVPNPSRYYVRIGPDRVAQISLSALAPHESLADNYTPLAPSSSLYRATFGEQAVALRTIRFNQPMPCAPLVDGRVYPSDVAFDRNLVMRNSELPVHGVHEKAGRVYLAVDVPTAQGAKSALVEFDPSRIGLAYAVNGAPSQAADTAYRREWSTAEIAAIRDPLVLIRLAGISHNLKVFPDLPARLARVEKLLATDGPRSGAEWRVWNPKIVAALLPECGTPTDAETQRIVRALQQITNIARADGQFGPNSRREMLVRFGRDDLQLATRTREMAGRPS